MQRARTVFSFSRVGLLIALASVGCGASPAREVAAPVVVDACTGQSGLVVDLPEEIASEFDGRTITSGHAGVALRWCGAGTVAVRTMTVVDDDEPLARAVYEFGEEGTLAHGEELRREITAPVAALHVAVMAIASTSDGTELTGSAGARIVRAARYVEEEAACAARGGTYAPAGLARAYFCDAPTRDAGRRCLSSAECEALCVEDHTEAVGADHGTCAGGAELRVHVGRCAATTMPFGCIARLDQRRTECVQPGATVRQTVVCAD